MGSKDKKNKVESSLTKYAELIKNNPFIMYIMPNKQVILIPLEREDLEKPVIKIFNKMHELNLDKALSLTYYDPETGKTYTQPFLMYIQTNFFTLDNEDLVGRYLLTYISSTTPLLNKIMASIKLLENKLTETKDPQDIEEIAQQLKQMKHYVTTLLEKNQNLVGTSNEEIAVESEHLKPASQVITPYLAKYLNKDTQDLTEEEINELVKYLYEENYEDKK